MLKFARNHNLSLNHETIFPLGSRSTHLRPGSWVLILNPLLLVFYRDYTHLKLCGQASVTLESTGQIMLRVARHLQGLC